MYNGWKNHATWDMNLNLTNEEGIYRLALSCQSASDLKHTFEEEATQLGIDINEIDWDEIYEGLQQ